MDSDLLVGAEFISKIRVSSFLDWSKFVFGFTTRLFLLLNYISWMKPLELCNYNHKYV